MNSIEISQEFLSRYDAIYDTLFTNYTRVDTETNVLSKLEDKVNSIAFQSFKVMLGSNSKAEGVLSGEEDDEDEDYSEDYDSEDYDEYEDYDNENNFQDDSDTADEVSSLIAKNKDTDIFKVFKFIALSGINSFYGLSNLNDIVVSKDGKGNKFGYKGAFTGLSLYANGLMRDGNGFMRGAYNRLLATERTCDIDEYFDKGYYVEDIKRVSNLLRSVTRYKIDDDLRSALVMAFNDTLNIEVSNITSVYSELLAPAFGIDNYEGVFTFNLACPVVGLDSNFVRKRIEPVNVFAKIYQPIVSSNLRIKLVSKRGTDRQFDYSVIFESFASGNTEPIYFPYKILEIISLGDWTATKQLVYKGCANGESDSLDKYLSLLDTNFRNDIFNYCAYVCKQLYKKYDSDITNNWTLVDLLTDIDCPYGDKFKEEVKGYLRYYTHCVTTAVIVSSLDTDSKMSYGVSITNILAFRIKVVCNHELVSNQEFCSQLSKKLYNNKETMSDIVVTSQTVTNFGVYLRDFEYTFDADKVNARPIFAYKALTKLQDQGMQIDWNNMLLGRYTNGSICRSASGEKINLQAKQLHNIYAGSRSGKGVMCFNIFATAIASGKPLFYIDRKPDTAVVLKALSGGGMFAVNGGQYDATIDLQKQFSPDKINYRVPKYLEMVLDSNVVKGDLLYFRGVLLCFCLVAFMDKVRNKSDSRYIKISSKLANGCIFVFDEFTNFLDKFLSQKVTTQGWFKSCYSDVKLKKWGMLLTDLITAKSKLDAKMQSEKASEADIMKLQSAYDTVLENITSDLDISNIYFSEFSDCYVDTLSEIPELFRSAGDLVKQAQFFIIGQNIMPEYYNSAMEFVPSNGGNLNKFIKSVQKVENKDKPDLPLIGLLKTLDSDFILGHQPNGKGGDPRYLAQGKKGTKSSQLLSASMRCFAYHKGGSNMGYDTLLKFTDTEAYFNGKTSEMNKFLENEVTYFKPFLILNNADVPPDELLQPDLPNLGVSDTLESKRKGAKGYTQYSDSQYVGQCLTTCNRAGLTWEDLLKDNKDVDGKFHNGVGFEGYITQLCGTVPVDKMCISGDIMSIFVNEVFGYKDGTWLDFLADFRPEALFRASDFINAIDSPDKLKIQNRLSRYFFSKPLIKSKNGFSFAVLFKDELGSLAQYYPDENGELGTAYTSNTDSGVSDDSEFVTEVEDEIFNNTENEEFGEESNTEFIENDSFGATFSENDNIGYEEGSSNNTNNKLPNLTEVLMHIEDFDDVDSIRSLIMPYKWEDLCDTDKNNLLHPNLSPKYNSKIAMSVDELRNGKITLGWITPKTLQVLLAPYKKAKSGDTAVDGDRGTSSAEVIETVQLLDISKMLSVCGYAEVNIRSYLRGYGSSSLMSRDLKLLRDMTRFFNNTDSNSILEDTLNSVDELASSDDLSKVSLKALAILISPYVSNKSRLDDMDLSLIEDLLTMGSKDKVLQGCVETYKKMLEDIVSSKSLNMSQKIFDKIALMSAKILVLETLGKVK